MLIHISMLTIWTSDTSFTAEPIGDQLSSLKQESQDTTTIVQTKVCIQSKFVPKFLDKRSSLQAGSALFRSLYEKKASTDKVPWAPSRSPVRNLPPVHLGGGLDPQTRCTQEYENTESKALKSWTNLWSYLDCHNFGRSSHQRPTNALFAGRQNKAKLRVASY